MADEGRPYDPQKDASAQEPLTANELKLVTRLLGDPFAFPMEFKAWLRGWLEEQFPRIGTLAVSAETGAAGAFVPPPGAMLDYGGDVAPGGYVLCNGAEYLSTAVTYQRLFGVIGFKFGVGPSSAAHFKVPNREEAMSLMRGASAGMNTIGQRGGKKEQAESDLPAHGHPIQREVKQLLAYAATGHMGDPENAHSPYAPNISTLPSGGGSPEWTYGLVGAAGSGAALGNMPPFLVVNVIISLGT